MTDTDEPTQPIESTEDIEASRIIEPVELTDTTEPATEAESEDAVARPSRSRMALWALAVFGALVFAGIVVAGYQTFSARLAAARSVDEATELVNRADAIVVQVDAIIRAKVTTQLAERSRAAIPRARQADDMLEQAVGLIDGARRALNDDEREKAALLRDAAVARRLMVKDAPALLEANAQASSALSFAEEGWTSLLEAIELSERATESYAKATKKSVRKSRDLNRQAKVQLGVARDRLDGAENAFAAAPFDQYLKFLDLRVEMNGLSLDSDEAWLAGEIGKADEINARYNKLDKRAARLAKDLPSTPVDGVSDAFEQAVGDEMAAYYRARDAALAADERLRAY